MGSSFNRFPKGWWTKERIFEEAKKYSSKSDFHKFASQAYKIALKEGWIEEMDWFPERKIKWTKEAVFEESKKYSTRSEFQDNSTKAYLLARENGWIHEMPWIKTPTYEVIWTYDMVIAESRKYKSRSEFRESAPKAYRLASDNGWLDEMTWLIKVRRKDSPWTKAAVFEEGRKYTKRSHFKRGSSIPYRIAREHGWLDEMEWFAPVKEKRTWDKESVFAESKNYKTRWDFGKNCSTAYGLAQKHGWLDEMPWLEKYVAQPKKWTKEAVFQESQKYMSRWEFGQKSPAYQVATKKGWINEMPWLLPHVVMPRKWTKEAVFEESKKYKSLKAFYKSCASACQKAMENDWVDSMPWLERKKKKNGYWNSKEHVLEEARKYSTLTEFIRNKRTAYLVSKREGWLKDFTWLKQYEVKPKKWNKEAVFEEAIHYKTRYEFSEQCSGAYQVAVKKGWLYEMDWLSCARKPIETKWTKDSVIKEAQKYEYRSDFRDFSGSAYNVARRHNWLDEMSWFKTYDHCQPRKWTKPEVIRFSKQFHSRSEFQDANSRAYQVARDNNWLDEMPWIEPPRRQKWLKEEVFEESRKYSSRSEFVAACGPAYAAALRKGWLSDMPWLGTPLKYDSNSYYVYAYEDNDAKIAYVGLTLNPQERHVAHSTGMRRGVKSYSAVYKYFSNQGKVVPAPIYLENELTASEARELEDYWLHKYEAKGFTMLNKGKTGKQSGSLGSASRKWTHKRVLEESKKYSNKAKFASSCPGAYNVARKKGWLPEMTWFKSGLIWTKESVFEEGKKYRIKKEFIKGSPGAYDCAHRNGWLPEMTWFENGRIKWTKEKVFEEGKKYNTKKEFMLSNIQAFRYAQKMHWIREMTWFDDLPQNGLTNAPEE